jgi:hypothetical protein
MLFTSGCVIYFYPEAIKINAAILCASIAAAAYTFSVTILIHYLIIWFIDHPLRPLYLIPAGIKNEITQPVPYKTSFFNFLPLTVRIFFKRTKWFYTSEFASEIKLNFQFFVPAVSTVVLIFYRIVDPGGLLKRCTAEIIKCTYNYEFQSGLFSYDFTDA